MFPPSSQTTNSNSPHHRPHRLLPSQPPLSSQLWTKGGRTHAPTEARDAPTRQASVRYRASQPQSTDTWEAPPVEPRAFSDPPSISLTPPNGWWACSHLSRRASCGAAFATPSLRLSVPTPPAQDRPPQLLARGRGWVQRCTRLPSPRQGKRSRYMARQRLELERILFSPWGALANASTNPICSENCSWGPLTRRTLGFSTTQSQALPSQ